MSKRTQVFVSYSHADSEHLLRLKVHLRPFERQSQVDLWSDARIKAGQKWRTEIETALERAAVAVLLISADFLASDFIAENEIPPLLHAAQEEGVKILPVVLKPCTFSTVDALAQFQAVNDPSLPLISLNEAERESIWVKLAQTIHDEVKGFTDAEEQANPSEIPLFGTFDWIVEMIRSEIKDPSCIDSYEVYQYEHIDFLELMPTANAVLQRIPNRNEVIESLRRRFKISGWEGDGEIQVLWLPPFLGAGLRIHGE